MYLFYYSDRYTYLLHIFKIYCILNISPPIYDREGDEEELESFKVEDYYS